MTSFALLSTPNGVTMSKIIGIFFKDSYIFDTRNHQVNSNRVPIIKNIILYVLKGILFFRTRDQKTPNKTVTKAESTAI